MADHPSNGKKGANGKVKDPVEIFAEGTQVDAGIRKSMRDVRILHKRMGVPLVGWKNGKLVKVPPEEIQIDDEPAKAE